jgi:methionine-rich copper-binding protein CopC
MIRRRCGALLLAAVCTGVCLSAHLTVVKTQPVADSTISTSPERLAVWFSQAPSNRLSRLELRGPNGDQVIELEKATVNAEDQSLSVRLPATLTSGTYTVAWRTAGDDGHVMRGTFTFRVQPAR